LSRAIHYSRYTCTRLTCAHSHTLTQDQPNQISLDCISFHFAMADCRNMFAAERVHFHIRY
jgi:hypothetical protein